jgi:hypothetical protein
MMIREMECILGHTLEFMRLQIDGLSEEEMVLRPSGAPNHAALRAKSVGPP